MDEEFTKQFIQLLRDSCFNKINMLWNENEYGGFNVRDNTSNKWKQIK